jgi:hypothetical protein
MKVVVPMVAMLSFSVLYAGTYVWMRRPKFGESEKPIMGLDSRSIMAPSNPKDDYRGVEQPLRNVRDALESTHDQVELLKKGGL